MKYEEGESESIYSGVRRDAGQDGFVQRMRRELRCRKRGVPGLVMYDSNGHLTFLGGNRVRYTLGFEI